MKQRNCSSTGLNLFFVTQLGSWHKSELHLHTFLLPYVFPCRPAGSDLSLRIQEGGVSTIVSILARQNNPYRAQFVASALTHLSTTNTVSPK